MWMKRTKKRRLGNGDEMMLEGRPIRCPGVPANLAPKLLPIIEILWYLIFILGLALV